MILVRSNLQVTGYRTGIEFLLVSISNKRDFDIDIDELLIKMLTFIMEDDNRLNLVNDILLVIVGGVSRLQARQSQTSRNNSAGAF